MHVIDATQAQDAFDALLDLVQGGEEVVILRRGNPVARMLRVEGVRDREAARAAAGRIRARAAGHPPITKAEWRAMREERGSDDI